jgi:hypothetical protein
MKHRPFLSGAMCEECFDFLSPAERHFGRQQCYECRDMKGWSPPCYSDDDKSDQLPRFHTTRADELAILRAVYDLGLIKEGDIL